MSPVPGLYYKRRERIQVDVWEKEKACISQILGACSSVGVFFLFHTQVKGISCVCKCMLIFAVYIPLNEDGDAFLHCEMWGEGLLEMISLYLHRLACLLGVPFQKSGTCPDF